MYRPRGLGRVYKAFCFVQTLASVAANQTSAHCTCSVLHFHMISVVHTEGVLVFVSAIGLIDDGVWIVARRTTA
jgi:hypothetical protein